MPIFLADTSIVSADTRFVLLNLWEAPAFLSQVVTAGGSRLLLARFQHSSCGPWKPVQEKDPIMADFWKTIAEFDPRNADPHLCWALGQMENEHYVTIKNGKILPTGKVALVSPESILNRPAELWKCNLWKEALIMEAEGLVTIENGCIKLTAKGTQAGINMAIPDLKEGKIVSKTPAPAEGEIEVEVDDEVYAAFLRPNSRERASAMSSNA